VDWINYIYDNQQRFNKYTRDAIKGFAEQTEATSWMAWQNRIALDMLMAEKGKVYVIIRTMFVLTSQIAQLRTNGLTTLAHGLADNSGVDTSLTNWVL
jgi:hypothetical protein